MSALNILSKHVENLLKIILANFFKFFSKVSPTLTTKIAWSFFCTPRVRKKALSKLESKLLQQAKQYFINSGDYKIAVYEWESPSDSSNPGNTILLSHGWGGHALNFSFIINQLLKDGFHVIAYDSPAHGNSSGKQTTLFNNTQALLKVVKNSGPIYALIGHSFGNVANAYALDLCKQETCLSQVEKNILIAGPNKVIDIFAAFAQEMKLSDKVLDIFHQKVETISQQKIEDLSVVKFLKTYAGQSLLIHDRNDRIVPYAEAETVAESIAACVFDTTGNGHFRILAAKSVIQQIIGFLKPLNS